MNLQDALPTFFAEADELLADMEATLLLLERGEQEPDSFNQIFRAAHTIKGSAGIFGLQQIVDFTHVVENLLDHLREGRISLTPELIAVLLDSCDHMQRLVEAAKGAQQGEAPDPDLTLRGEDLILALELWLTQEVDTATKFHPGAMADGEARPGEYWTLSVKLGPDTLRNGMDPLSILSFLSSLGEVTSVLLRLPEEPSWQDFDPETLYLEWQIELASDAGLEAIDNTFMFVREDADIRILPSAAKNTALVQRIADLATGDVPVGELLLQSGAISEANLQQALVAQTAQASVGTANKLGEILVQQESVAPQVLKAALEKQQVKRGTDTRFIRVDAEKLDQLINLVGELVISRQRVEALTVQSQGNLKEAVELVGGFTEQIRDLALNLRMVQIGDTFARFNRIVRDTAKALGKDIELVTAGAETELDRTMVEKLTDPLTHIVRNAIDHGIEGREQRIAAGKPGRGQVSLNAYQEAGNIVIEICDDGGGLNLDRIRAKAITNGVIESNAHLTDGDIQRLIFHPGLSTAESVTNLSGRGVGMDVVKRNIESLQGAIDIESELGVGTEIRIRLPLTLAIIDGFHVVAGDQHFIIPENTLTECLDLQTIAAVKGQHCVNLRGELVPLIRLRELFGLSALEGSREQLVVVQFGQQCAGLVVDQLLGELQTVVKPLGPIFQALRGIGGSTLLGNGAIAFILDIPQLLAMAAQMEQRQTGSTYMTLQETR